MVNNATFNNISVISWRSVLLVEETGVPGENHWPAASHWQTLSHNIVSSTPPLSRVQTHTLVVIGFDFIGSWNIWSRPRRPTGTRIPDPPFSSFGPSRDYGMHLCWKYIFKPFIHILQHFVLQLSRSTNFCFYVQLIVLLICKCITAAGPRNKS